MTRLSLSSVLDPTGSELFFLPCIDNKFHRKQLQHNVDTSARVLKELSTKMATNPSKDIFPNAWPKARYAGLVHCSCKLAYSIHLLWTFGTADDSEGSGARFQMQDLNFLPGLKPGCLKREAGLRSLKLFCCSKPELWSLQPLGRSSRALESSCFLASKAMAKAPEASSRGMLFLTYCSTDSVLQGVPPCPNPDSSRTRLLGTSRSQLVKSTLLSPWCIRSTLVRIALAAKGHQPTFRKQHGRVP